MGKVNKISKSRRNKGRSKKIFFIFAALFLLIGVFVAFHFIKENGSKSKQPSGQAIKLAVNSWDASKLDANIAKIILKEKMGIDVTLVGIDEYAMWPELADGRVDASLEVWPSGHTKDIQKYIKADKTVEDGGYLGPIGKIGWYIPAYLRNEHPELATWRGFKDPANVALFAPAHGSKGVFYTGDPTWTQYDNQIIKNLGLNFEVKVLGSEDALLKTVDSAYKQKKPIVFYFWTPHWAHVLYDLVPVELPAYSDSCYSNLNGGVACDYPKDQLTKVFWSGFKDHSPRAYQFLKKFSYSNQDQIGMLAEVQINKKSVEEVARDWTQKNENVWKPWTQ